jgi:hypothetical protein
MQDYLKYKFAYYDKNMNAAKKITAKAEKEKEKEKEHEKMKEKQNNSKNTLFIPRENDSLFWCYYIILNGDVQYEMITNRNTLVSKQFKIEYVSKIRENKQVIKLHKFDTIANMENNLANDATVNIKTIMTLCAIDNINLIYVSKKSYFELLMNDTTPIYIIRELEDQSKYVKKYGYELASADSLQQIRDNLYKLDSIDKPIKSISSYKLADLTSIVLKLGLSVKDNNGKNKTKNELYESIVQYF